MLPLEHATQSIAEVSQSDANIIENHQPIPCKKIGWNRKSIGNLRQKDWMESKINSQSDAKRLDRIENAQLVDPIQRDWMESKITSQSDYKKIGWNRKQLANPMQKDWMESKITLTSSDLCLWFVGINNRDDVHSMTRVCTVYNCTHMCTPDVQHYIDYF